MGFNYYYNMLKNVPTDELLARQDDEQYVEEYRYVCKKIIEARANGEEKEPNLEEKEFKEEINEFDLKREVPKSIDECCKMDGVSKSLLEYSKSVKTFGIVAAVIMIIVGIIVSAVDARVVVDAERELIEVGLISAKKVGEATFNASYFFISLFKWIIASSIVSGACSIISILFAALASIVYSNRITANVALYSTEEKE